jgi:hypothetical protein
VRVVIHPSRIALSDLIRSKRFYSKLVSSLSITLLAVLALLGGEALAQKVGLPEVAGSSIGFSSPAEALATLHARSDVEFSMFNGWTIASIKSDKTVWSFAPISNSASPAAVKREVVEVDGKVQIRTSVLCVASKAACDDLVLAFLRLNSELRELR